MFGVQTDGRTSGEQQREGFLTFVIAVSPENFEQILSAHRTALPFFPDNLPYWNRKFVVAEDGRKLRKPPLLGKRGHVSGEGSHGTC